MKCQILFSGKNKKNINLLSAELAQRVVRVKESLATLEYINVKQMPLSDCVAFLADLWFIADICSEDFFKFAEK